MDKLSHDLRATLTPRFPAILNTILSLLTSTGSPSGQTVPDPSSSTSVSNPPKRKLRQLPPETLQTLLSTLSSLFRYTLTPSHQLLRPSFVTLRQTMVDVRACGRKSSIAVELERMLAEVWGGVLRRVKGKEKRDSVVRDLMEGLEGCEDGVAWIWCFSLKVMRISSCFWFYFYSLARRSMQTPSHTLHPATALLVPSLISAYLSASTFDVDARYTLVKRVLTSFANHVKDAKSFASISDLLLETYETEVDALRKKNNGGDAIMADPDNAETVYMDVEDEGPQLANRVVRLWRLLAVVSATKKGARLQRT